MGRTRRTLRRLALAAVLISPVAIVWYDVETNSSVIDPPTGLVRTLLYRRTVAGPPYNFRYSIPRTEDVGYKRICPPDVLVVYQKRASFLPGPAEFVRDDEDVP